MDAKYEDFFEKMYDFKQKQERQKMRGLNDYNILTTVLQAHDEVRLHSRMIASFLNTKGTHYQNSLFFDLFIEILDIKNFNIDTRNLTVKNEFNNIDIYITDGSKHIIIENKIYAGDQENQIKRYIDDTYKDNIQASSDDIVVVYLSIDREEPSLYSLGDLKIVDNEIFRDKEKVAIYRNIHYKSGVLAWLDKCKNEIQNITNLNEVFEQYIQVVKKITGNYKGKVMSLKDELLKNEENYRVAEEIIREMPEMKKKVIAKFFGDVIEKLSHKLDNNWTAEVEKVGELTTKFWFPFRIYKKEWKQQKNYLLFGFEFDANNYRDGRFGLVKINKDIDMGDIMREFKSKIEIINEINFNQSDWWLFKHELPNDKSFIEQILFHGFTSDNFVSRIMGYINEIEIKHNLVSDINDDLKKNNMDIKLS